jgi:hypothetical protein
MIVFLETQGKSAAIARISESRSGVYILPGPLATAYHITYHQDGRRHLKIEPDIRLTHGRQNDVAIKAIEVSRNVGGFGFSFNDLNWSPESCVRVEDIIIEIDSPVRRDLDLFVSLSICRTELLASVVQSMRSGGLSNRDICTTGRLNIFGNHSFIIQLQYQI